MVKKHLLLILSLCLAGIAFAGDTQAFLKVNPLAGETTTSKSGGSKMIKPGAKGSSSKTVSSNMKWKCEARFRGKGMPMKVEVRAFYIGYDVGDMTPKILGKETKPLELDENGKATVELVSPTAKLTKTKTTTRGGGGRRSRGPVSTKSTTKGERVAGCVVQLWADDELVKSYASMSTWEKAAKEKDFSEESLTRKDSKKLN